MTTLILHLLGALAIFIAFMFVLANYELLIARPISRLIWVFWVTMALLKIGD